MSKYFPRHEIVCPCGCGFIIENAEFLNRLDAMREFYGDPLFPTKRGGICRCAKYNKEVGGKSDSEHLTGEAADLKCLSNRERFLMIHAALEAGFTRIEIGKRYLHIGSNKYKDQKVIWLHPELLR